MKSLHYVLFVSLLSAATAISVHSQGSEREHSPTVTASKSSSGKRGPVFRASKDQVIAAQTMLKTKGVYAGDASGKLDDATREAIKNYQSGAGLRATGTLNRATLEKMGIQLTDKQKAIPSSANSYASAEKGKSRKSGASSSARGPVFRATKEQIIEAQKLLRTGGMYTGEETGKLDDPTREGLKKYQEAKGLKATGTLNQMTLEKMGIDLTDKQKGSGESR